MRPLTIAVAQPALGFDPAANVSAHALVVRATRARVVVFPELSLTGYTMTAATVDLDGPLLAPLVTACALTGSIALVGAPVAGDHIATLAVDGGGARVAYRKQWPGAGEAERFRPGGRPAVLAVNGWRLGLAICRDTGIVRHPGDTAATGIDAYVAGTVMSPAEATLQAERASRIARERHVAVAVASFAGPTGEGYAPAAGGSGLWARGGRRIAGAGADADAVVRAVLH